MVNRPNLYIKIPATVEGIPAIEEALYEGIAVNVTLIFSRALYSRVMAAYLRGLERRVAEGKAIDQSSSVASFFISRVDSLGDKLIEQKVAAGAAPDLSRLAGKAGLANAKLAYQDFKTMFGGDRFKKLAAQGAHVQRPLWASTSTKNPAYSDTLYVDNLIGPDTVNTMPGETIEAFLDHGTPATTIENEVAEAQRDLNSLETAGISMDEVTEQLLKEGVEKFAEPFHDLLEAIAIKCQSMAATD
jgi:transaldolase